MKIRDRGVLSDEEIAYLFEQARLKEELELERIKNMGFLGITPEELKKIPIAHDRRAEERKFELLQELYVLPLMEKARRITNNPKLTFREPQKLSIYGRCKALFHYIARKEKENGRTFTIDQLYELIPTTAQDKNILIQAKRVNFNLKFDGQKFIDNNDRVSRAKEYLIKKGIDPHGKKSEYEEYLKERKKRQEEQHLKEYQEFMKAKTEDNGKRR